uniref:regulatory-associated protein of mTOR-like n=1 Tax=Panthera onca TaxID=9690 RepID=UPI002955A618
MTKMRLRSPSSGKHPFLAAARSPGAGQAHQRQLSVAKTSPFSFLGVSFNSVYTQIWRVLLHLAADPYPDVSDLAMKVLNSIAYKATVNARPQRILTTSSLTQSAPASPTNKGIHIHQAGGSPPTSSASSSSLTNDVAKQPVGRDLPAGRPGAPGPAGVQYTPHSQQFPRTRKMFDKGPDQVRSTVRPRCERRPCSPGRGPHPALRPQLCCTVCTGTTLRCHGALAPVAPCHGSLSWHLPRGLTVLPPSTWPHCSGPFH